jgi:hypothetical protein
VVMAAFLMLIGFIKLIPRTGRSNLTHRDRGEPQSLNDPTQEIPEATIPPKD